MSEIKWNVECYHKDVRGLPLLTNPFSDQGLTAKQVLKYLKRVLHSGQTEVLIWRESDVPRPILTRIAEDGTIPSITCPECGTTSYRPENIRNGYCDNCHDFMSKPFAKVKKVEKGQSKG